MNMVWRLIQLEGRQPGKQANTAKDLMGMMRIKWSVDTEPQSHHLLNKTSLPEVYVLPLIRQGRQRKEVAYILFLHSDALCIYYPCKMLVE